MAYWVPQWMLSIALLELKYQGLAGSLPNLASATDITPLGTLLGTTNLLKMLEQHADCMPVQASMISNYCKNLQITEGSKVSRALAGQELLLFLGLLSCVAHMMPAIH